MGTLGEGRRVRAFDLMHVTHPLCWLSYALRKWWERRVLPSLPLACQTSALLVSYAPEMERVNGIAPLSRPWHGRIESAGGSVNFRLPRLIVLWPAEILFGLLAEKSGSFGCHRNGPSACSSS